MLLSSIQSQNLKNQIRYFVGIILEIDPLWIMFQMSNTFFLAYTLWLDRVQEDYLAEGRSRLRCVYRAVVNLTSSIALYVAMIVLAVGVLYIPEYYYHQMYLN